MKTIKVKEFVTPGDYDDEVSYYEKIAINPWFVFNQLIINILSVLLCQQIL
jgi:hypothetical protein